MAIKGLPLRRWAYMGFQPNPWALLHVHGVTERFSAVVTCRQCGKSTEGGMLVDEFMTEEPDEFGRAPFVGILAPTYEKAEIIAGKYITAVRTAFGEDYIKVNTNKHRAYLPHNKAELIWMSGDDPNGDAGKGYTFSALVVDESQDVPDVVMEKIQPALDVREAPIRAFGTPDITPMQTWYKSMWMKGQDPDEKDYHSFSLQCWDNQWMSLPTIMQAKDRLSEAEFKMLYLAQWPDSEGSVFRAVENAVMAGEPGYNDGVTHIMSVDFAFKDDFTVVMVGEKATKRVIHMDRWSGTSVMATYDHIERIWQQYGKPECYYDESGIGLPAGEELRKRGMRVHGITITATNKMQMIMRLASDMEHRRIMFPPWKPLMTELRAFVYKPTPTGKVGAEAAYGFHDDTVSALMLLNEGFQSVATRTDQYGYSGKPQAASGTLMQGARMLGHVLHIR